jgi:uncharacterized membrane protein
MPNPRSTAQIAGHPIHPMLVPFPIAFLVGTLVSDIVYSAGGGDFWATASYWLLVGAIVMALLAAVAGFTDFFGEPRIREGSTVWYHMTGNLVAVELAIVNRALRLGAAGTGDPAGLWISLVTVLLLLFNGWMGWELVYRHRVGVSDEAG